MDQIYHSQKTFKQLRNTSKHWKLKQIYKKFVQKRLIFMSLQKKIPQNITQAGLKLLQSICHWFCRIRKKNVLLNLINCSLKFICMLKIHIKQNVNFLKIHEKEPNENVRKIQNLSLNTGKKLSIFLKILASKILKINLKYLLYLMI